MYAVWAIAGESQAVGRVHAFPAACSALGAIPRPRDRRPLEEKSVPQARDVVVPAVPVWRRDGRHDGDKAARRCCRRPRPVLSVAVAPEPPSKPDERGVVAGHALEPRQSLRHRLVAPGEEPELAVGSADGERPHELHGDRDVEARRRAAGGERQVLVHHVHGLVLVEDVDHPVRLEHGVGQERAAAVALELEGRRPARRLPWLLQPERVRDVQAPACLGRAALLFRLCCLGSTHWKL